MLKKMKNGPVKIEMEKWKTVDEMMRTLKNEKDLKCLNPKLIVKLFNCLIINVMSMKTVDDQ